MSRFSLGVRCVWIAAALAAIAAQAQTSSPQTGDLVIHQRVRRVVVDVMVTGADGQPVHGLTADDFSVSEDGKPQNIRSFDVHDFDSQSDSLPKLTSHLPANTFVNVPAGPERGPLYVLLLDLVDMSVDDQPYAREQLLKFIRSKPLGTRFAIFVYSDGLHLVQGFTEDRNALAAAVDPKNPRSHLPRIFLYADNFQPYSSVPRVFINISKFLAELPGHKNLIWLSASFPAAVMPSSDSSVEPTSISDEIQQATDTLARGQVAVYPVDVRGAVVTDTSARQQGGAMVTSTDSTALNASYLTEQAIAHETGGRAFFSSNDIATALEQATETGGHYYTLSYSPTNENYDGRLRHIRVELSKGGYQLSYRRSYYGNADGGETKRLHAAADLQPLPLSRAADSLYPNMQHGAPLAHQLLFRAHIHALRPPAKATAEQMANLADQAESLRQRRKQQEANRRHPIKLQTYEIDYDIAARYPTLEVAAAAFDEDGKILNVAVHRSTEANAGTFAGERRDGLYRIEQQFDVPVGAVSLRMAVRDVATDNVGALEITLPLAHDNQAPGSLIRQAGDSLIMQVH